MQISPDIQHQFNSRDCYLRFSSQTYSLRKLHESIHLTNNSIQQRYNTTSRDVALPDYNMWDSKQFKCYLNNIGYPAAFSKIIYPGMKESITAAILMNQDKLSKRPNSFELYGADFMLTEDFQPWLLEINSKPALGPTTPITAKMCPQVLEDLIKGKNEHNRFFASLVSFSCNRHKREPKSENWWLRAYLQATNCKYAESKHE